MDAEKVKAKLKAFQLKAIDVTQQAKKRFRRIKRNIRRLFASKGPGDGWREKALHRWNMDELINFFEKEMNAPARVIYRLEESEIDGSIMEMTLKSGTSGDQALMSTLKVDALMVRKFRRKIQELQLDKELDVHERELIYFLGNIIVDAKGNTLLSHKEQLFDEIGVTRVTELPFLIDEPGFFDALGLTFTEEARLKAQIRNVAQGVLKEGRLLPRHLHMNTLRLQETEKASWAGADMRTELRTLTEGMGENAESVRRDLRGRGPERGAQELQGRKRAGAGGGEGPAARYRPGEILQQRGMGLKAGTGWEAVGGTIRSNPVLAARRRRQERERDAAEEE